MDKTLTAMIGTIFGLVMVVAVSQMAGASQPTPQYACPIDGELFFTYDELYQHFITQHPATPIDILWE